LKKRVIGLTEKDFILRGVSGKERVIRDAPKGIL